MVEQKREEASSSRSVNTDRSEKSIKTRACINLRALFLCSSFAAAY